MKYLISFLSALLLATTSLACTASFTVTATPTNNDLLRIILNNSSSYGTVPTGYRKYTRIDFGDGTIAEGNGGGGSHYHSYASAGTYNIKLVALVNDTTTGSTYCGDSITNTVTVAYPSCGTITSYTYGTGGAVTYSATNPAGATGITYTWYFGDGSHATGATVTHTYVGNGVYTVTLNDTSSSATCDYSNSFTDTISSGTYYCDSIEVAISDWGPGYPAYDNFIVKKHNPYPSLIAHTIFNYGDGTTGSSESHMYSAIGKYIVKMETSWVDTFTHSTICTDTATDTVIGSAIATAIFGSINFDSAGPALPAYDCKVWLISFDTSSHIVTAIDSAITTAALTFTFTKSYPNGIYLIKAKALYDTSGYGYVPTYYDSGLYWNAAHKINYLHCCCYNTDVYMQHGTATSGPGFIAGNVLYGAGKTTGSGTVGAPVQGLLIMLLDSKNKLIKQTYTDASGNYAFNNLALGDYTVFPESLGYTTTAANLISLTSSNPGDTSVSFKQNSRSIYPSYLNIPVIGETRRPIVYPNPSSGSVVVQWDAGNSSSATITILNIEGQVVYKTIAHNASGTANINLSYLPNGSYFVNIQTTYEDTVLKMTIVH